MRTRLSGGLIGGVGLALASVLVVGCVNFVGNGSPVTGSGPITTEDRQVGSFDKVEGANGLQVVISIGSTPSVKVTAQQNIVPLVSTTVANGTLTAKLTGSVIGTSPITVTVVTPSLTALTLHDGTSATVTGVAAEAFALDARDGAHAELSGTAANLTLNAEDGAFLQLTNLIATNISLSATNGVTGEIHATGAVTGSASNGVLLSVVGGGTVTVNTSGGAIVTSR